MPHSTIFALATPAGRSGVAVIRLSGSRAGSAAKALTGKELPAHGGFHFTAFRTLSGELIDRGLVLYFKAPNSFTGEEVVELHTHGSLAVIRQMLDALGTIEGLRPAEAGEFTRRAFINGKLDLTQAEGLADLIEATTDQQKSQAMRQLEGSLSQYYEELRRRMVQALAHMEAYIDFPDEEIPESVLQGLTGEVDELRATIETALRDDRRGQALREGLHIVILGAPNAGKSSLLNMLSKKEAAIVSHTAGTTRDVIEVQMDIAGFPVVLTDTAGLRESDDAIEAEGIRRAMARAGQADITIILFDGTQAEADAATAALIDTRSIIVHTKADSEHTLPPMAGALSVSAKTGQGIEALMETLAERTSAFFSDGSAPMITRARHKALLGEALGHLQRFCVDAPLELSCEELRRAALSIGKITGKIEVDDVLDHVFRQFCIGK
jgi:tRNA modification GTPase